MRGLYTSIEQLIGNTPTLRLDRIRKALGLKADIVAKLEYPNPAGSTKDRIAKAMIEEAERSGRLKNGAGHGPGLPGHHRNARGHVGGA